MIRAIAADHGEVALITACSFKRMEGACKIAQQDIGFQHRLPEVIGGGAIPNEEVSFTN